MISHGHGRSARYLPAPGSWIRSTPERKKKASLVASITQPVSLLPRFADASRLGGGQEFDLASLYIHDFAGICAAR